MNKIVTGWADGKSYNFRVWDLINDDLTNDASAEEVANVLAANLEDPVIREDGTIEITRSNFNDSFHDMIEDLQGADDGYYGSEDDDDEE